MHIFNLSVPTVRWEGGKENPWKHPHGPASLVHIGVRKNPYVGKTSNKIGSKERHLR